MVTRVVVNGMNHMQINDADGEPKFTLDVDGIKVHEKEHPSNGEAIDAFFAFGGDSSSGMTEVRTPRPPKNYKTSDYYVKLTKRQVGVVLKALKVAQESFYFSGLEQRTKDRHKQAINIMEKLR